MALLLVRGGEVRVKERTQIGTERKGSWHERIKWELQKREKKDKNKNKINLLLKHFSL